MARVHAQTHFDLYYTSIRWAHFQSMQRTTRSQQLGNLTTVAWNWDSKQLYNSNHSWFFCKRVPWARNADPFHHVFQLGTHVGRVEPGSECEPVHSNIHARPLDYTATVQATNTVLKCELCTLAYILHKVEGQSFKMVVTCIHTLLAMKPLWIFRN